MKYRDKMSPHKKSHTVIQPNIQIHVQCTCIINYHLDSLFGMQMKVDCKMSTAFETMFSCLLLGSLDTNSHHSFQINFNLILQFIKNPTTYHILKGHIKIKTLTNTSFHSPNL